MPTDQETDQEKRDKLVAEISALETQMAGLDKTTAEWKKYNKELGKAREQLVEISKDADTAASSLSALGASGKTATGDILAGLSKTASESKEGIDAYYKLLGSVSKEKRKLYQELHVALGTDFTKEMENFSDGAEKLGNQVGGTIQDMYQDYYDKGYRVYFGDVEEFMEYASEVYLSVGSGFSAMRSMGDQASEQIESAAMMARGLGFSSTEMMDAMDAQFSKSGEFSNKILREITTYSNLISKETGDSNKVIAKGILDIRTNFESFGKVSVETAAMTVAGLRSVGLEVKDLASIADKYMNFDSASESLANLNTLTGMQIDTMAMMEAAAKDPFDAMMMLREGFLDTGQDYTKMTLQQQKAIAAQVGLSTEATARLLDPSRVVANMEDLTAATEAQQKKGVDSTKEALEALEDSMATIPEHQQEFSDAVFNTMANRDLAALTDKAALAHKELTKLAADPARLKGGLYKDFLPEDAAEKLEGDIASLKGKTIGILNDASAAVGEKAASVGRNIPSEIVKSLEGTDAEMELKRAGMIAGGHFGEGFNDSVTRDVKRVQGDNKDVAVVPPAEDADDLYIPRVGMPKRLNMADEVLIGKSGGPITTAIADFGSAVIQNVDEIVGSIHSDYHGTKAVSPTAKGVDEFTPDLKQDFSDAVYGSMAKRSSPPGSKHERIPAKFEPISPGVSPPINLNLEIKLGPSTILALKDQILNAGPVGDIEIMRETV